MPKRGALSMTMRRSRSPSWPERSTCSGAPGGEAGAAGRHVVDLAVGQHDHRADALGRDVGEARRRAGRRAAVPSTGAAARAAGLDRAHLEPRKSPSRACSAAAAAAVVLSRPSRLWLALLSTTSATTVDSGSRSSRSSTGLRSARNSDQRRRPPGRGAARAPEEAGEEEQRPQQRASAMTSQTRQERLEGERPVHWPSLSSSAGTCTWSAL